MFVMADETETLTDPENDVMDYINQVYTTSKPNVDIISLTYHREGKEVTITLEVKGEIEDRGNINDILEGMTNIDLVLYYIELSTSSESYIIRYVNGACNLSYSSGSWKNISTFSVNNNVLTVWFDLLSSNETFDSISAGTTDIDMPEWYEDLIILSDAFEVYIESPYDGKVGENINFSAGIIGGTPPYTWTWDFGDGESFNEENSFAIFANATHAYSHPGTYNVTLTVTDSGGLTESDYTTVTITGNAADKNHDTTSDNLIIFIVVLTIIIIIGIAAIVFVIKR